MTVDEMIDKLDIHGVLMMQGMLVNRGLRLLHEEKESEPSVAASQRHTKGVKLIKPDPALILPSV